jgi:hypothetical protein
VLTAKVSGRYVDVQNGHLEISEEDKGNVIFVCEGLESRSKIVWVKDGVYLNTRNKIIKPFITVDPSKSAVNLYSMQGTYWCEARIPGCSCVFSSNKVNLTFESIITMHITFQQNKNYISFEDEIAAEVNKFQLCDTKRKTEFDIRKHYTTNGYRTIATHDLSIYIANDTVSTIFTVCHYD